MLMFYLCVRSVILGLIKILTELFVQLFLKRRGKTIPRKNYLHWGFFKAGRVSNSGQWLSKYFFIYQTPADFISHEEYVMLKCFVYCKILSLFILLIHLYYVRLFFLLLFCLNNLQAHDKEQECKQLAWKLSLSSNFLFLFWRNMN